MLFYKWKKEVYVVLLDRIVPITPKDIFKS